MGHEFLSNEEFKTWEVWVDSPASTLPPQEVKVFSPDYVTVDRDTAVKDFRKRIKHYEDAYEPLSLEKEGWVKKILLILVKTNKQTNKQTNRQTDRQTDKQTNKSNSSNWKNPLHNLFTLQSLISVFYILHTVLYTFTKVLTRRICLKNQELL